MVCIFAGCLAACGGDGSVEGVRVIFELEGGEFKNSKRAVSYYYGLEEGESTLIRTPDEIASSDKTANNTVSLTGYHITGWCKTRSGEAGSYTYSDPWDFTRDKISYGDEPLTLYAVWARDVVFSYNVCYRDESGVHIINSYTVSEGDPFRDSRNFADKRSGYTAERRLNEETNTTEVVYYDENDEPWDPEFRHPGGEESTAVNVFAHYIKGEFNYVVTADEFEDAVTAGKGVWLLKDVDLEGKELAPFMDANGRFRQAFYGNGHTVSNFTINSPSQNSNLIKDDDLGGENIYIAGIFGRLSDAIVKDVTFSDVTILIKTSNSRIASVRVAPLAPSAKNSTVENVTVNGKIRIERLASGLEGEAVQFVTEEAFCVADDATKATMKDITMSVTLDDARS